MPQVNLEGVYLSAHQLSKNLRAARREGRPARDARRSLIIANSKVHIGYR